MIKSFLTRIFSLLFILSFSLPAFSQSPVQVIPSVLPPYSTLLSEYYSGDQTRLSVTLLNTDAAEPFLQGYLRISIEGQGVKLQSVPFGNYPTIDLMTGAPVTVSQSDLAPYFSPQHLQGNGAGNQNRLPEGYYQFCFEVLEKNTGRLIGSKQCAQAYLTLSDPAFLVLPEKGKVISYTNPFNLLFQWTPRHINILNSEYEFTLVEIWDEAIAPEAAFYTAKPIYTTTTNTSNLFYGPGEPQLIMGKKYAWRVRTKVTTSSNELEPFKNDGYSEIFWFKLQGECPPLQKANVVADPRTNKTTLSWVSDPVNIGGVKLDYRKKGSSAWKTIDAESNQVTLTGLAWSTDYEYQLGNRCVITDDFAYGSVQSFRTLNQDTSNCVPAPAQPLSNQEPLASLKAGDVIFVADFAMRLTTVSGSNGNFSGEGAVGLLIPTTTTVVGVKATFTNISVNTDYRVFAGKIISKYDATESNVGNLDPITKGGAGVGGVKTGNTTAINVNTTIDPLGTAVITETSDSTYTVAIPSKDGQPVTITTKKLPVTVQDKTGKIYTIDKDGKITPAGQASMELLAGKTATQLNQLSPDQGKVSFEAHPQQVYAFDPYITTYGKSSYFDQEYENLNGYRVGNKLLVENSTDKITATVSGALPGVKGGTIHFITAKGVEFAATKKGDTYEITLLSGPASDAQELYAIYRDEEKIKADPAKNAEYTYSLGKLKISTYASKEYTVKLVPIDGASVDATAIAENLNKAYNPIGVTWNVILAEGIGHEGWNNDSQLDISGAGNNNKYSAEMQQLNAYYKTEKGVDAKIPYLFIFKTEPSGGKANVEGDMLRNRQFGYLFPSSKANLAAHELAHGFFHLEHTFASSYYLSASDLPQNLMNYNDGRELIKFQWDAVHAPGMVFGLFENEGDAESLQNPYVKCIEDPVFAATLGKSFYDPDGNPVTLSSDMQPYSFFSEKEPEYYGRLAAYKKGGDAYIYLLKETSQGPEFAGRWYKVGSAVPKTEQQAMQLTKLANATNAKYIKFNSQCQELASKKYITNCTGCPLMPHERKTTNPKGPSGGNSANGTVINNSQDANGNYLVNAAEASQIESVIGGVNTQLGTKTKTYIINKQNKNFAELLAAANADPSKEKVIIIVNGTKDLHTIDVQHKIDAPKWLQDAFAGVGNIGNGCSEAYINEALGTLHTSSTYKSLELADQVTAEIMVCVYRGVFGSLYCATNEQSVANKSATMKYVAGAVHELVATVDVAEMIKGLGLVLKSGASTVVNAQLSYLVDVRRTYEDITNGRSVPIEELIIRLTPPDVRIANSFALGISKVATGFTKFYFTECESTLEFGSNMCPYRYGQVTVMIIPVVLTAGEWAFVKVGGMVARLRTFNNLRKTEDVARALGEAEKIGATVTEELNKITIKEGENITTIVKNGDEVIISREILGAGNYIKFLDDPIKAAQFADEIIEINKATQGGGVLFSGTPSSAINTGLYYATVPEQGASIFKTIIKNHMFADGNKRTAVNMFKSFCNKSGIKTSLTDGQLLDIATQVEADVFVDVLEISQQLVK